MIAFVVVVFFFFQSYPFYCTNIYPIALMYFTPLSGWCFATLPHTFESSGQPPVPNPILESHVKHSSSWLLTIPILAFYDDANVQNALNPSLLHLFCKEAAAPISVFHVSRRSDRWPTWFPVRQTQSPLQEGCIRFYQSSRSCYNEGFPVEGRKLVQSCFSLK